MPEPQSRKKQVIYGVLFVLLMSVAGIIFWRSSGSAISQLPDTADSRESFMCFKCGEVAELTPRGMADAIQRAQADVSRPEGVSVRELRVECPKCHELAMVRAMACSQCGNPYVQDTRDGKFHVLCRACEKLRDGPTKLPDQGD
ncbi:MAG TPA: hypothetical protein VGM03_07365 [Phycisphaerae bacterium]